MNLIEPDHIELDGGASNPAQLGRPIGRLGAREEAPSEQRRMRKQRAGPQREASRAGRSEDGPSHWPQSQRGRMWARRGALDVAGELVSGAADSETGALEALRKRPIRVARQREKGDLGRGEKLTYKSGPCNCCKIILLERSGRASEEERQPEDCRYC